MEPLVTENAGSYREGMSEYRRPGFATEIYCDEQGHPIDYGHRWPGASPPEDAYSRVSHLQRFAPLHEVADALIEWLRSTFDAVADQDPGVAQDLLHLPADVVRAVRIVPSNPQAAPLTFVFTGFPGIFLHAGALHDSHYPVCGCDACDDDVPDLLENLESMVRAVVSGGYFERFDPDDAQLIEYRLAEPGSWEESGRIHVEELPEERVESARAVLPPDGHWLPWPEAAWDASGTGGH